MSTARYDNISMDLALTDDFCDQPLQKRLVISLLYIYVLRDCPIMSTSHHNTHELISNSFERSELLHSLIRFLTL